MSQKSAPKAILILGGGGMRAFLFHIGACLALKESGFEFIDGPKSSKAGESQKDEDSKSTAPFIDTYIGLSAGALMGLALANGYSLSQIASIIFNSKHQFWKEFDLPYPDEPLAHIPTRQIFSLKVLTTAKASLKFATSLNFKNWAEAATQLSKSLTGGMIDSNGIKKAVEKINKINKFSQYKPNFYVISTQLNQLQRVVFGPDSFFDKESNTLYSNKVCVNDAIAAGVALPPLFAPYQIPGFDPKKENCFFYDGCILDYAGMDIALKHNPDIIINLAPMASFESKKTGQSLHTAGVFALCLQAISQILDNRYNREVIMEKNKVDIYDYLDKELSKSKISSNEKDSILTGVSKKLKNQPKMPLCINSKVEDSSIILKNLFILKSSEKIKIVKEGYNNTKKLLKAHKL